MQAHQCPHDEGCYDTQLLSEDQDILEHRRIEPTRGPGVSPLLYQQAGEPSSFPPRFLEIPVNGGTVTVVKEHHPCNLFEGIHLLEELATRP